MKCYSVSEVRQRLSHALDEADAGKVVLVERRGIRYQLVRESEQRHRAPRSRRVEILDPAVDEGQWTWARATEGLAFRSTARRRKP